jgi:alpha-1,2-mannosyltransferase
VAADARWRTVLWLALVAAVLAIWFVRARRAASAGDETGGFALTAVLGCLVSPVTWVHHLVWLIPALVLVTVRGRWWLGVGCYLVLCSRLVWAVDASFAGPLRWMLSNAYVWVAVALLVWLPVQRVADLGQLGAADRDRGAVAG